MLCFSPFHFLSKLNVLISVILLVQYGPLQLPNTKYIIPFGFTQVWQYTKEMVLRTKLSIHAVQFPHYFNCLFARMGWWCRKSHSFPPYIYPIINLCPWYFSYYQTALSTAVSQAFSLSNKYLCWNFFLNHRK